ncbi:hypothetical protein HNQ92_002551 [Rhabdobacter roseus]|uniref:Uncharacterized protein n=1 Tax=Rhabdobacter roseus TaxID=1655419 RepID=A0A840TW62_9BACT|nr:hypothetical protein [Rhabdobacter roseus]MBB5284408.1 hypothetical protein [Rhabdobacter roseus]
MKFQRVKKIITNPWGLRGFMVLDQDGEQIPELNCANEKVDNLDFFKKRLEEYWADEDTEWIDGGNLPLPKNLLK